LFPVQKEPSLSVIPSLSRNLGEIMEKSRFFTARNDVRDRFLREVLKNIFIGRQKNFLICTDSSSFIILFSFFPERSRKL
jgi:hypothetical protein